jgi:hypothetical protein
MFSLAKLNWSAILLAILIAIIGWQFYSITSERDDYFNQLTTERHAHAIALAKKEGELKAKLDEGKRNKKAQDAQHIADIQHIGQQYGRELNDKQATINRYRSDITDSVRKLQALNDRFRQSENDADRLAGNDSDTATTGPGEESAEFYRKAYTGSQQYIETLEQAGAICAADYNRCYAYVKSEQGRLGVEQLTSNPR